MNILFFGTPEFAVPSLKALNERYGVKAVFTKVDKPNTRGKKIKYTPVKEYALEHNIPVYQPESVKTVETAQLIRDMEPDLIVVVAYGKIIPNEIIDMPKFGIINVHSSILPKFRGAAPINAAIVAGEKETGVTIMEIAEELDAGDIITVGKTPIFDSDDFLTLHDRLKEIGAEKLLEAVSDIFNGKAERIPQDHSKATFVKPFKKEDCNIDWNKTSEEIFNFVRGMNPFPGTFTHLGGKLLKIISVEKVEKVYEAKPGQIVDLIKGKGFVVATGDTGVILTKVKPENKNAITGADSINGKLLEVGEVFNDS